MAGAYWLSDRAWRAIAPLLPTNQPGARRVDDRRLISGIIQVLRSGCRWQDCPACYGPATTIDNRSNRWSHKGLWTRLFCALCQQPDWPEELSIDSTAVRALAWWPDHENPRPDRRLWARSGVHPRPGKRRRHLCCARPARPAAAFRSGCSPTRATTQTACEIVWPRAKRRRSFHPPDHGKNRSPTMRWPTGTGTGSNAPSAV